MVGILLNMFYFKKNGKESIPNISFWNYFVGLVWDGFAFTFLLITCKTQQATYDSFGSTSAGDSVYTNADGGNVSNKPMHTHRIFCFKKSTSSTKLN